eukprot:Rhum_TRINITY_DN13094_c0_g1::Rhum_TRINITY_DN13094_c0_g1_i1::g.56927::m.56927
MRFECTRCFRKRHSLTTALLTACVPSLLLRPHTLDVVSPLDEVRFDHQRPVQRLSVLRRRERHHEPDRLLLRRRARRCCRQHALRRRHRELRRTVRRVVRPVCELFGEHVRQREADAAALRHRGLEVDGVVGRRRQRVKVQLEAPQAAALLADQQLDGGRERAQRVERHHVVHLHGVALHTCLVVRRLHRHRVAQRRRVRERLREHHLVRERLTLSERHLVQRQRHRLRQLAAAPRREAIHVVHRHRLGHAHHRVLPPQIRRHTFSHGLHHDGRLVLCDGRRAVRQRDGERREGADGDCLPLQHQLERRLRRRHRSLGGRNRPGAAAGLLCGSRRDAGRCVLQRHGEAAGQGEGVAEHHAGLLRARRHGRHRHRLHDRRRAAAASHDVLPLAQPRVRELHAGLLPLRDRGRHVRDGGVRGPVRRQRQRAGRGDGEVLGVGAGHGESQILVDGVGQRQLDRLRLAQLAVHLRQLLRLGFLGRQAEHVPVLTQVVVEEGELPLVRLALRRRAQRVVQQLVRLRRPRLHRQPVVPQQPVAAPPHHEGHLLRGRVAHADLGHHGLADGGPDVDGALGRRAADADAEHEPQVLVGGRAEGDRASGLAGERGFEGERVFAHLHLRHDQRRAAACEGDVGLDGVEYVVVGDVRDVDDHCLRVARHALGRDRVLRKRLVRLAVQVVAVFFQRVGVLQLQLARHVAHPQGAERQHEVLHLARLHDHLACPCKILAVQRGLDRPVLVRVVRDGQLLLDHLPRVAREVEVGAHPWRPALPLHFHHAHVAVRCQ